MTNIAYRTIGDGVAFRSIPDCKFKTMRISMHLFLPLCWETAAANALLPFLLSRTSREYPDYTKLGEHLADLYGAALHADVQKVGDMQVLSISASGISDRYALNGEHISAELAKLLCSVWFDPLFDADGQFPEDGFQLEKRQTLEMIDSEFSDKRMYAKQRCAQIMCAQEPYGIPRYGSREAVEALTREELKKTWETAIQTARIEILAIGDCNPEEIRPVFETAVANCKRTPRDIHPMQVVKTVSEVKEETEQMAVAQSKLVMGFRLGASAAEEDAFSSIRLMVAILGGTAHSKLFLNVREKLSLCYYCAAGADGNKGIMMVDSGVETQNISRAREEILAQLASIRSGDFTDEEIDAAKMSLCNSYRTVGDYISGLEGWYLVRTFQDQVRTPEETAARISAVTREEIIAAAKRTALDTVYILTGGAAQ